MMNWTELEKKLIGAARTHAPSESVPYAFEQRVMCRVQSRVRRDDLTWWNRAFWAGAAACSAVAVAASVWSFNPNQAEADGSFSQGLEQTLFASAEDPENGW